MYLLVNIDIKKMYDCVWEKGIRCETTSFVKNALNYLLLDILHHVNWPNIIDAVSVLKKIFNHLEHILYGCLMPTMLHSSTVIICWTVTRSRQKRYDSCHGCRKRTALRLKITQLVTFESFVVEIMASRFERCVLVVDDIIW